MTLRRLAVAALMLSACQAGEQPVAKAPAMPDAAPIRLVATEYAFGSVPDTVQAGWHKIVVVNQGKQLHMAVIARLDSGRTVTDYVAAVRAGTLGDWAPEFGGPNAVMPGDSLATAVNLSAGRYAVVCFVPDSAGHGHVLDGMIAPFTVAAAGLAAMAEPIAGDTVHLSSYSIAFTSPPVAGSHVYRIEDIDAGKAHHDLVILRLADNQTPEQVTTWLAAPKGAPPFTVAGATTGMLPGFHDYMYLTLAPGNYLALCLMPDDSGGRAHFQHGMTRAFRVSS